MGNVSGITISAQLRNLERVAARAFASAAFRLSGGRCGSDPRIGQQIFTKEFDSSPFVAPIRSSPTGFT